MLPRPNTAKQSFRPKLRHHKLLKVGVVCFLIFVLLRVLFPSVENLEENDLSDDQLMDKYNAKDISELKWSQRKISSSIDKPFQVGCREIDTTKPRANAAMVMLAQNEDLEDVLTSMKSLERHFNQWFKYPWVFLNDREFDEKFRSAVAEATAGEVRFGVIPKEHWDFSEEVDPDIKDAHINDQGDRQLLYGGIESYHKMCRFFSGFFFKHELIQQLAWYWRVEPKVQFFCDITYDPFVEMEKRGKKYGFTIMIPELHSTVPNLFRHTKAFIKEHSHKVGTAWYLFSKHWESVTGSHAQDYDGLRDRQKIFEKMEQNLRIKKMLEAKGKKSSDLNGPFGDYAQELINRATELPIMHIDLMDGEEWNSCHFWSNFEIARVDLFNSPLYEQYFQYLDAVGGFYKERWGDAAVHSLAVGLMLQLDQVHYFRDIGYQHAAIPHCPKNALKNQLKYTPAQADAVFTAYKPDKPAINGVGCRCKCPPNHDEYEDNEVSCMKPWHRGTRKNYRRKEPIDVDVYEKAMEKKLDEFLNNGGKLEDSHIAQ